MSSETSGLGTRAALMPFGEIGATDFRLRPGSAAVDAGCRLPNVNDDFTGRGPDLGALELDRPVSLYGPRR